MVVTLRRMFWLAVLGGAGYVGWTTLQRRAHEGAISATAVDGRSMPPATTTTTTAAPPSDRQPDDPSHAADSPAPALASSATMVVDARDGDDVIQLAGLPDDVDAATDAPRWVAAVDGVCPDGYPIKANANSGIYHVPGGRFYDRTIPERCYAHTADAEADGYRRAKA